MHEAQAVSEVEQNATVAIFATSEQAEEAVRALESGGFDMTKLSILAKGMTAERHVMGFDNLGDRVKRWTGFGAGWGALFGALLFIPGVGHVAGGGYLLTLLATGALGAGTGALGGALASIGVPKDSVIRYETALEADKFVLVAHGSPDEVEQARGMLEASSGAEDVEVHSSQSAS